MTTPRLAGLQLTLYIRVENEGETGSHGRRVGDSYLLRRPHGSVPVHVTAQSRCGDDDGSVVSSGSRVFEEPEQKTDTWSLVQGTGSGLTPGKRRPLLPAWAMAAASGLLRLLRGLQPLRASGLPCGPPCLSVLLHNPLSVQKKEGREEESLKSLCRLLANTPGVWDPEPRLDKAQVELQGKQQRLLGRCRLSNRRRPREGACVLTSVALLPITARCSRQETGRPG